MLFRHHLSKSVLLVLFGLWVVASVYAGPELEKSSPERSLRDSTDLYADAQLAREQNLPLLIFFAAEDCPYCAMVEEEFLEPMLASGDYVEKVIIRRIMTDDFADIRDFDGNILQVDEIAHRYRASFTPTVVFLDPNGKELEPRLLGITNRYYYGGDLDLAIERSLAKMRALAANQF